uniref:Uncharacterized protein n=1 Tax=Glossina palpalis gambiensis TaxID=67801 RepID=A0A1B0B5X2_9MUSC
MNILFIAQAALSTSSSTSNSWISCAVMSSNSSLLEKTTSCQMRYLPHLKAFFAFTVTNWVYIKFGLLLVICIIELVQLVMIVHECKIIVQYWSTHYSAAYFAIAAMFHGLNHIL